MWFQKLELYWFHITVWLQSGSTTLILIVNEFTEFNEL